MTFLVIDDIAYIRVLIKNILVEECGFNEGDIIEASCGIEALSIYEAQKPDIIFCDILMPDFNGIEVVEKIMSTYPNATIIMCTSSSEAEDVKTCIGLGAKDYILKPPTVERIKLAIEKVRPNTFPETIAAGKVFEADTE